MLFRPHLAIHYGYFAKPSRNAHRNIQLLPHLRIGMHGHIPQGGKIPPSSAEAPGGKQAGPGPGGKALGQHIRIGHALNLAVWPQEGIILLHGHRAPRFV